VYLCRAFVDIQVAHEVDFEPVDHCLMPNGDSVPVTGENRGDFVEKYVRFLLVERVKKQFNAFQMGFARVCEPKLMEMFKPCPLELEQVVCGSHNIDIDDLRRGAVYDGGYTADSDVIKWFWDAVLRFDEEKKRRFLKFVTGSERAPVGGLSSLIPVFKISKNGLHSSRLPTAHVCFNTLLLPQYDNKEWLADRLHKAIENDQGFGLM
jgi:ubiquitin-protein ligase E3 A